MVKADGASRVGFSRSRPTGIDRTGTSLQPTHLGPDDRR